MTLLYSGRKVMQYARNAPLVIQKLYKELDELDGRIDDVESGVVAAGSISETEIANGAVTESKLGTGAVTSGKIGTGAVGTAKLADDAVSYAKLDATGRTYVVRFDNAVVEALNTDTWEKVVGTAPFAGNITDVQYIPNTGFGQDTNTAALTLYNRGVDDNGTTAVASKNFTAANAVAARVPADLTVSGVPADVAVTAGQVLTIAKTTAAGDSQIVPAGVVEVTIVRTA